MPTVLNADATRDVNALLKRSGVALRSLASENTLLVQEYHKLSEKLEQSTRREELWKLSGDFVRAGLISVNQQPQWVEAGAKSGRSLDEFRDLLRKKSMQTFDGLSRTQAQPATTQSTGSKTSSINRPLTPTQEPPDASRAQRDSEFLRLISG
jgi:hypothetical protein